MLKKFFTKSSALTLFFWLFFLPFFGTLIISKGNSYYMINVLISITLTGSMLWLFIAGAFAYHKSLFKRGLSFKLFKASITSVLLCCFAIFVFPKYINSALAILITILCIVPYFYILYFFSKALTSAEFKKETGPMTYIGTFIFLSGIIIGILLVQPRIQKLHDTPA